MVKRIGQGLLEAAGILLLLGCGVLCGAVLSIGVKGQHPMANTLGMLTLFGFPSGATGFLFVRWAARWRRGESTLESSGTSVPLTPAQRIARGLMLLCGVIAFLALAQTTSLKIAIPLGVLIVWLGGSLYFLYGMDGWSTIPSRVRERMENTIGLWVYGLLHAMALVVVNVVWLIITGGRGGLIAFGGGRSGGGGSSKSY